MKIPHVLKPLILVFSSFLFPSPAATQEPVDSLEISAELEEIVIEGRTRKVIKNGVEVIPSKRDKKFSTDAYSLLRIVNIPGISIGKADNSIKTSSNEDVTIFIDNIQVQHRTPPHCIRKTF